MLVIINQNAAETTFNKVDSGYPRVTGGLSSATKNMVTPQHFLAHALFFAVTKE
jgi:hypothetical protein